MPNQYFPYLYPLLPLVFLAASILPRSGSNEFPPCFASLRAMSPSSLIFYLPTRYVPTVISLYSFLLVRILSRHGRHAYATPFYPSSREYNIR